MNKTWIAAAAVCLSVMLSSGVASAAQKTHVAGTNDTFWKLSKQYKVSVQSLMDENPKIDPLNIYKGLKLTIPVNGSASAATAKASTVKAASANSSANTIKALSDGKTYAFSKSLQVKATAYTAAASENGGWAGLDYFGNKLKVGTIAVDPKLIPLGTKVYITGYDYNGLPQGGMIATATDIGGSIKGNRIDIFVPDSRSKALKFGIQQVKVYILD